MRLAVSMWSYVRAVQAGRMDIPGFIREAHRAGADGVELLTYFYKDPAVDRVAAKASLEETGLPCPIYSISQNFAKLDPSVREAELEKIRFGVGEAKFYGSEVVRVFAGDVAEGITYDMARGWIIEGLVAASRFAADQGVRLALENHGSLAGRGEQVRELIEEVRAKSGTDVLGANPDTGNFLLVGQKSHEAIAEVAQYAHMVHFKDFAPAPADHTGFAYTGREGERYVRTAVGEGMVDLAQCLHELRHAGFDGWLSVEFEGEEPPESAVARSIATAKQFL